MIRILCYGDSNTWGYISGSDHKRYNELQRWTKRLQSSLGNNFEVIEEGLCSRTLFSEYNQAGKEGRNGFPYLKPCLESHDKVDIVILMLGTNELKYQFGNTAQDVLKMLIRYVEFIRAYRSRMDGSAVQLLVSGLPLVRKPSIPIQDDIFQGASQKSVELNDLFEAWCQNNEVAYVNNNELKTGVDNLHLSAESHAALANKLAGRIQSMFPVE